jgi:hypothetical protein
MTTPMQYLNFWFIKNKLENNFPKETTAILACTCRSIDGEILNRIRGDRRGEIANIRDLYLDYFCSFPNFNALVFDLGFKLDDYYVQVVAPIFDQKFPMERSKLQKMWNLKPKGIS